MVPSCSVALENLVHLAKHLFASGGINGRIALIFVEPGLAEAQIGIVEHIVKRIKDSDLVSIQNGLAKVCTEGKVIDLTIWLRQQNPH